MAGIHQYTSSQFIQSGSAAKFQTGVTASEITVEGTVFATEYKKLDGSLITGTGGIEFFAGSGSGVSRSLAEGGPFSQDHFFTIEGDNKVTENSIDVLTPGLIKIETTGSSTFNPNYFNFIKVGNDNEDLTTVQQGSISSYTPESIPERQAGTHRYIIYAAQTGSSGETHQAFHTVTLDAFVNEKPIIVPGTGEQFTISIVHDNNTGNIILHSTESTDANIEAGEEDFFTKYEFSQLNFGGNNPDINHFTPSYEINAINHLFEGREILSETSPGISPSFFFFTASLNSFNILYTNNDYLSLGRSFVMPTIMPNHSSFNITIEDNYPNDITNAGTTTVNYKINITPPNKATIENSRVEFESSGFTNELTSTLEQTLLYDFDHTLNSSSILNLNDRYTSSLVRLKALANITEPSDGLNPPFDHYTKFRIQSRSEGNDIISDNRTLAYFRINGNEQTASAVDLSDINGDYLISTESNGFKSFEFYPNYTNNTESLIIGTINEDSSLLNNTHFVQHGTYNHFEASINNSPSTLILKRPFDINISDISIEVASGSYEPIPSHQLTSSLLYGFTSSLLSDQTQSLITNIYDTSTTFRTTEMLDKFLSQSIVKVRVKAKITEPFGPTHNGIGVTLDDSNGKNSTFTFSTESQLFNSNPDYEDVNGQELLVGRYTSSWQEFKFIPQLSNYEFGVSFTNTNPSSNVGLTISDYTSASITMSNAEPIEINNVIVEVESGSFATNLGYPNLTSSLLYGLNTTITSSQTESIITNQVQNGINNPNHNAYISQSIVRARIKTQITEPFGPITSNISASIVTTIPKEIGATLNFNPIVLETTQEGTPTGFFNDGGPIGYSVEFQVGDNALEPQTTNQLTSINITKVEIKGDLVNGSFASLKIGNYTIFSIAPLSALLDVDGNSLGNDNPYATIWEGDHPVSISGGVVGGFSTRLDGTDLTQVQVRVTFKEPLSGDGFTTPEILFQADESNNYNEIPSYNESNQLVSQFTSSFIEIPTIPSGTFNFTHNFTSESTVHTTSLDLTNAQSAEVSMSSVEPTLFKDIRYEIETHGYSEIGVLSAPRTILFGDYNSIHHTYETSESQVWSDGTLRADAFASQSVTRFRVLTTIEEPFGPGISFPNIQLFADNVDTSDDDSLIGGIIYVPINYVNPTSNQSLISSSISDYADGKLRTAITSSWIGKTLQSSLISNNHDQNNYKVTSSLSYNMVTPWESNNSIIVNATNTNTLTLLNHDKTKFTNINYFSETFGYSEITTNTITRSVLYGDDKTNSGTGSFDSGYHFRNHINKVPYASHSVSRFKSFTLIEEPVGHLHGNFVLLNKFIPEDSTYAEITNTFLFNSSSTGHHANVPNYVLNKLQLVFETNYLGQQLPSSNQDGYNWTYTGSYITAAPTNPRGFTEILNVTNPKTEILVKDTPDVEITRGIPLIETFGDSEIGVDNQNIANFTNKNRTLITGEITTFKTSSNLPDNLTGSAVLRIQNQIKIKEPLGYAHKNITSSKFTIKTTDGSSTNTGPTVSDLIIEYNTASANLHTSGYDENFLLTSSYTSSFDSGGLALGAEGYVYEYDSVNFSFKDPQSELLNASNTSKQLAFRVIGSSDVQISNLSIEVENTSGSGTPNSGVSRTARSTQILYGNTTTETNHSSNSLAPNVNSKNQLVSARVLLTQTDPIGITHFTPTVVIKGTLNSPSITFSTQSTDVSSSSSLNTINGLVVHYTSSFFPLEFGVGDNQIILASASKVDDLGTTFASSSNSNEIDIDVTGPPSPTIDITSLTFNENLSQSKFDPSDSANSNYFVLKPHNDSSDQTINVTTNHDVTKPTLRTGSSAFPEELDITYINTGDHSFGESGNPTNGTGSLIIDVSDINNDTNINKFTITSKVEDEIVGTAEDTETVTLHTIPAQPKSLESDNFTTKIFHGHPEGMENTLYHGRLPHGLVNYETSHANAMDEQTDAPPAVTNLYRIGFGNGDDITFHTHTDGIATYTGNYSTLNRPYNFGDSGSLEVKLNGATVVNYNLQNEFVKNNKYTLQTLSGYTNNGTASFTGGGGELILNKVAPFNNISQSIQDGDIIFPNGYQAWHATIKVTEKARSGSNVLQLIHNISQSNTQSAAEFKWYYDEHDLTGATEYYRLAKTTTVNNSNIFSPFRFNGINPQHQDESNSFALSGIHYFKPNTDILYNFASIYQNLANDALATTNGTIASMDPFTNLHIATGSDSPSSTKLSHNILSVSNKRGLVFDNGGHYSTTSDYFYNTQPMVDLIPSISLEGYSDPLLIANTGNSNGTTHLGPNNFAHGSVQNMKIKGINVNEFETAETNAAAAAAEVATAFTNHTAAKEASASAAALAEETPTPSNINAATNASSSAGDTLTIYNDKKELRDEANDIFYTTDKGEFRQIDFEVLQRSTSSVNGVHHLNQLLTVGRFANPPVSTQTRLIEDFSSEEFRLSSNQGENINDLSISLNQPGTITSTDVYGLFTSSISCSYNSSTNIQNTNDLQVTITNHLKFPTKDFKSGSKNIAPTPHDQDYSNVPQSPALGRTFYRAFAFTPGDFGGTFSNIFSIEVTSSLPAQDNFYGSGVQGGVDLFISSEGLATFSRGMHISIAFPGPKNINNNGLPIQTIGPGTAYGLVNANFGFSTTIMENNWVANEGGKVRFDTINGNAASEDGLFRYRYKCNVGQFNSLSNAGGVVILKIAMKNSIPSVTPILKQIRFSPNISNGFNFDGTPL